MSNAPNAFAISAWILPQERHAVIISVLISILKLQTLICKWSSLWFSCTVYKGMSTYDYIVKEREESERKVRMLNDESALVTDNNSKSKVNLHLLIPVGPSFDSV